MQAKLTWMQMTGAHLYLEFATVMLLYYSHACHSLPACSNGKTLLKRAIDMNKLDVVALLRSVGAAE